MTRRAHMPGSCAGVRSSTPIGSATGTTTVLRRQSRHVRYSRQASKLVFVGCFKELADAARCRADTVHERFVFLTLAGLCPSLARVVVVCTNGHTESTRVGALLHHCKRIVKTFASLGPDSALRGIVVRALDTLADTCRRGGRIDALRRIPLLRGAAGVSAGCTWQLSDREEHIPHELGHSLYMNPGFL